MYVFFVLLGLFFDADFKSEVHFFRSEKETLNNPEIKLKFLDYRGFPVPADKNGYRF